VTAIITQIVITLHWCFCFYEVTTASAEPLATVSTEVNIQAHPLCTYKLRKCFAYVSGQQYNDCTSEWSVRKDGTDGKGLVSVHLMKLSLSTEYHRDKPTCAYSVCPQYYF